MEISSLEPSLAGDETKSSSDGVGTASSSSEESSGDKNSAAAPGKRAEWVILDLGSSGRVVKEVNLRRDEALEFW